jgi:hypothetical protein
MSGSSKVELTSTYFHVSSESPCMNFATEHNDPGFEQRWHRDWKANGDAWLVRVTPILEQRFEWLAAQLDPDWPIMKYDPGLPLWTNYRKPDTPPPWRIGFVGMGGPGMTQVTIAFSSMPCEEARERLKQELIKDVAMIEGS